MEKFLNNQPIPLTQVIDPNTGQAYYSPQNSTYEDKNDSGPTYLQNVIVDNAISASYFSGSITNAVTASYALTASYVVGFSASVASASYALTASYVRNAISSSFASTASFVQNAQSASYVLNAISASFANTSSITNNAINVTITDNPSYGGVTFYPTFVSSTSGPTNLQTDSSVFTYNPSTNILTTTSSYATNALSSSFASTASFYGGSITSASYATTASYVLNAVSASYAATSSISDAATANLVLVLNQSGYTLTKGTVVHITASQNSSDTPRVISASYENDNYSANTLGITYETITNGSTGYVTTEGVLLGINTSGFQSGQLVYLGASGSIVGTAPLAPLHAVRLGQIIRVQSNNGSIYVRVDNGYELGELHDVRDFTTTSSYGDLLVRSGSVWTNLRQLTGSYGLTGSLNATSFTGSLFGTSSWANNTQTASYVVTAQTASYVLNAVSASRAITSSYVLNAVSASFASTASFVNPLTQSVTITGSLTVNGNNTTTGITTLGNGTFTKAGSATGDVLLDNNGTDTPGVLFYYGNSSNYGIDSWNGSFDVLSGQLIRTTNKLNETGGAVKMALDTSGNVVFTGFVKANAWRAGQVVNDIMLSNTEVTISTTTIATSNTDTDFLTYSYTPLSSTSYLVIHYHLASYDFTGGTGNDSYFSRIKVDGTEITYSSQSTVNGFRTGVLFPLTGRYTNSSTAAKSIVVAARRNSADDSITIVNTATSMWLRITEIAR